MSDGKKAELAELEHIRELFTEAFKATEKTAQERVNEQSAETKSSTNLEIKTNEEYNEVVSHSLKNIVNEGYTTEGTKWAIASGLLTEKEQAKFWEDIANISKRGYRSIPKSKNGQYIIDVGQKLIFTNGDFKAATISNIIEFHGEYEANMNEYKEWIIDEERSTAQHGESIQIIEIVQGEGYVSEHLSSAYRTDARQNGKGKGKNSTEVNRKNIEDKNPKNGTEEAYNNNKSYSLKWHTGLTKAEIEAVERWVRKVGSPEATKITDIDNWYKGRLNGQSVFVIYSAQHKDNPTILYEVKGEQGEFELKVLKLIVEDIDYGTNHDRQSEIANEILSIDWVRQSNSVGNSNGIVGRGTSNSNATILQGQSSQRNPSPAFRTVVKNLFKEESVKHSLKSTNLSTKDIKISMQDVKSVQNIGATKGRISVNSFDSTDIKATENFARKYNAVLGVKSPFFRAYFGDWRVNDKTPVAVVTQSGANRGISKNKDTGWDIQISGKVFNETVRQKNTAANIGYHHLNNIDAIVENAVLLDSSLFGPDKKSPNSFMMHSLYALSDTGQGMELVKLFVDEMYTPNSDNTLKRAYKLNGYNKFQLKTGSGLGNNAYSTLNSTGNTYSVADLFDIVKRVDKNFNPKPSSLVVNKDGTPKVVYHTTSDKFTVFDITKSRSWDGTVDYDLPGFYFAEKEGIKREISELGLTEREAQELIKQFRRENFDSGRGIKSNTRSRRGSEELQTIRDTEKKDERTEVNRIIQKNIEDKNLKNGTEEAYNNNKSYSLKWHTGLTKAEIETVERWVRKVGSPEATKITDIDNWYKGRLNGKDLFVIYSTKVADNPTVLYVSKDKKAKVELDILMDLLEDEDDGTNINGKSSFAQRVSKRDWVQNVNSSQGNLRHMGNGRNNQNAGVLQGQSQRNGSRAFRNVLENLFGISDGVYGRRAGELNEGKRHLLKEYRSAANGEDSVITKADVDAVQSIGRISVNDFTSEDIKKTEKFARKYFEEMETKSPFFRAWFGDWRANDHNTPITVTRYDANAKIPGSDIRNEDSGIIAFLGSLIKSETKTHAQNKSSESIRLKMLSNCKTLFENSILLDSYISTPGGNKSNKTAFMHNFYGIFQEGKKRYLYKFFVEEFLNEGAIQRRGYEIKDIKIVPISSSESNANASFSQPVNIGTTKSVSDLFNLVKQNDKNFNPKDVNPAMLNEDGTPKVFYHGTDADFTEFDISKGRANMDIQGSFFSTWELDAKGYGQNVGQYYLNIKKPASGDVAFVALNRFKGQNNAGVKAREYLIKQGFDGVDFYGEEYIAFYPEQIKSATGNIGTFDKRNPNVNYSLKGEGDLVKDYEKLKSGQISSQEYEQLLERYGSISPGENPYREVQVPKNSSNGKKVSQTVRTILEAKVTPDEAIPTIEKMVEDGVFSYDEYSDKQAIEKAESDIKEYGWTKSLNDWLKDVENGVVSKQHTAMGWALYNNASNTAANTTSENERKASVEASIMILDAMVKHQRSAAQQ